MPLLFNFVLDYAIRRDQVNQDGWKFNGVHQFLVHADDVNRYGDSDNIIRKNTDA